MILELIIKTPDDAPLHYPLIAVALLEYAERVEHNNSIERIDDVGVSAKSAFTATNGVVVSERVLKGSTSERMSEIDVLTNTVKSLISRNNTNEARIEILRNEYNGAVEAIKSVTTQSQFKAEKKRINALLQYLNVEAVVGKNGVVSIHSTKKTETIKKEPPKQKKWFEVFKRNRFFHV